MLFFLKLLLVTTAWDLPVPGVGPQSSCVQTPELGHCSTPGDIIHEDKDAKRIAGSGATGTMSPGFQSSSLPVMLAPGSGSMSWSPGALPALGLYPFCLRVPIPLRAYVVPGGRNLSHPSLMGTKAMGCCWILAHPLYLSITTAGCNLPRSSLEFLPTEGPLSPQTRYRITILQPFPAALRISLCCHSVTIIEDN